VDNGATRTYSYDTTNQLTADGTNTYTYDGTGNRNNGSWSTPAGNENELQSDGTWTYSYDNEGNLTKKTKGSLAETWVYGYDNRNQMTSAKQYDKDPGSGGVLQQEVDFKYDWWGNRIEKDIDSNGDGAVDTIQRYAQDGWDSAKPKPVGTENFDVWADLDGSSSLTTRYMHGDVVDQLFARVAADGTGAWLMTDHLGSVVGVTDNSGVLKDTIAFDGFGNFTETHSAYGGDYKWTGRQYDPEEKLQYNRSRYYDAATGRWTSQDPLGFGAGDSNLFRYAFDMSTALTDPSGKDVFYLLDPNFIDEIPTTHGAVLIGPLSSIYQEPHMPSKFSNIDGHLRGKVGDPDYGTPWTQYAKHSDNAFVYLSVDPNWPAMLKLKDLNKGEGVRAVVDGVRITLREMVFRDFDAFLAASKNNPEISKYKLMLRIKTDREKNLDAVAAVFHAWEKKYYRLLLHNCTAVFYEACRGAGKEVFEPPVPGPALRALTTLFDGVNEVFINTGGGFTSYGTPGAAWDKYWRPLNVMLENLAKAAESFATGPYMYLERAGQYLRDRWGETKQFVKDNYGKLHDFLENYFSGN
jgi:RHS repeat-associated protein